MGSMTCSGAVRVAVLLAAFAPATLPGADWREGLEKQADQAQDAAKDPNKERAAAKEARRNDGGTIGGGSVDATSDKKKKKQKGEADKKEDSKVQLRHKGSKYDSEGEGKFIPKPKAEEKEEPKAGLLSKAKDFGKGIQETLDPEAAEENARWNKSNMGSANNSKKEQLKALIKERSDRIAKLKNLRAQLWAKCGGLPRTPANVKYCDDNIMAADDKIAAYGREKSAYESELWTMGINGEKK